jgi:hypothetical protein
LGSMDVAGIAVNAQEAMTNGYLPAGLAAGIRLTVNVGIFAINRGICSKPPSRRRSHPNH